MARKKQGGGRYTAPKPTVPKAVRDEQDLVASQLRSQDRQLRQRCAELLGDEAPTDIEWREADLEQMQAHDATDEELVAYWRAHRACVRLDFPEFVDLAFIRDVLARGADPVEELVAQAAAWDDEE